MALIRERDGKRLHVKSKLMGESLVSKIVHGWLRGRPPAEALSGRATLSRSAGSRSATAASRPCRRSSRRSPPTRKSTRCSSRRAAARAAVTSTPSAWSSGMPTGIIAKFGSSISEQNALLVATLLSPWGGIKIGHDEILKLSELLRPGLHPGHARHAAVRLLRPAGRRNGASPSTGPTWAR